MTSVTVWRRLTVDDEGFSLVEVLVSILILGITLLAVLSTIVTSLHAAQNNEARVQATALSNELLERMVAQPWDRLGLYTDEAPALSFEGQEVVLFPGTRDEAASPPDTVPRAVDSEDRGKRDYTVRRWITWVDDGTGQDFKRLVVELDWEVRGNTQTMRTETLRSPDPDERLTLEVRIAELVNVATGFSEVALNPYNADAIQMSIDVTDPDAVVWVSFTDRQGVRRTLPTSGSGLTRGFDIAPGAYRFEHGPATFAVTAETPGPDGQTASNVDTIRFFQPLVVDTPVVSGAPSCVDEGESLATEVVVDVAIEGMSVTSAVDPEAIRLTWPGGDAPLEPVASTPDGGTFRGEVPVTFAAGSTTFTVTAKRTPTDPALEAIGSAATTVVVAESTTESPC